MEQQSRVDAANDNPGPRRGILRSPLVPIFLVVMVDVFGFTLVLPLLPFYAEHLGASPLVVGFITASFALCQFIAGPILGRISDRVGRKPTLIVSQIGTLIGFLILGFANTLALLFLSRIIDGLTAGNLSIAQAYISDVTKPEERTKAFGLIGIAFGVGFLLGPAISGYLSQFGYQWPAFAAAFLSLCSILGSIFLLPKVQPDPNAHRAGRMEQLKSFFSRPLPRVRLMEFFLFTFSFSTLIGGLALYLERQFGYDAAHTGYLFAFSGLVGAIVQGGLLGRLVKWMGDEKLATLGFIAMAIGYGFLGWIFGLPMLLVMVVVAGFGSAVARPTLTSLLTKSVGRGEQGAALGTSQSLASIAQILGPVIAGWLIEHHLLKTWGIVAGAAAMLGATFGLRRGAKVEEAVEMEVEMK
jgi:multidrug resistance protein